LTIQNGTGTADLLGEDVACNLSSVQIGVTCSIDWWRYDAGAAATKTNARPGVIDSS